MKNDDLPHSERGSMGMWWKMRNCPHSERGSKGMWWKMTICPILKEEIWECDEKWWFAPFKKEEEVWECDEQWWFVPFKKGIGSRGMWWKMICPIQKGRGSMGMWWKMMVCPIQKEEEWEWDEKWWFAPF